MSFPRYRDYRPSGVAWLGDIPAHWNVERGRNLFSQLTIPPEIDDRVVTAFRDGQVTLRDNRRTDGFTLAVLEVGYQRVRKGDLVIHGMDAFAGAIGVSESTGKCTPEYSVLTPLRDGIDNHYFSNLLRVMAGRNYIFVICPSVRERAPRFRFEAFKDVTLSVPPHAEQRKISVFIDHEIAKINGLVAEQQRLIDLLNEQVSSLILSSFDQEETYELRLSEASEIISRPVAQKTDETYTRIGLFNRGRGLFHKAASEMDDMGESDFFWVEAGDLIISGQFAWEGAVALAGNEDADCVVSHRYPVIRGKCGVALTEYLFGLLCTKHGNFLLNENSRGAAGRNRPLNISSLMKEVVPIPSMAIQERVARAVHARNALLREIARAIDLLHERRTALISAAVTGQIDVRHLAPLPAA